MTSQDLKKLYKLARYLRKQVPATLPIYLRVKNLPPKCKYCGYCTCNGTKFTIIIGKAGSYQVAIDTLLHEWAHAISWNLDQGDTHGSYWGVALSNVYLAFLKYQTGA